MNIQETLFSMQDTQYRDFNAKLIPNISPETVIGVRTPELRSYAKALLKQGEADAFLCCLPHTYFEENQLHAFILSAMKDYTQVIAEVQKFLPYVDNWATCDQLRPVSFKKHPEALLNEIRQWLTSDKTYTIRFGIGMLMAHYLDDKFCPDYIEWVAAVQSDEYYVNMMRAWYFATALAKQYDTAVKFIENNLLDVWTHNKSIQKARESFRVSDAQKNYLNTLKRK